LHQVSSLLLGEQPRSAASQKVASQRSRPPDVNDRLQRLYHFILSELKKSKTSRQKMRVLGALEILLEDRVLGCSVASAPWILQHTVSLLLHFLRQKDTDVRQKAERLLEQTMRIVISIHSVFGLAFQQDTIVEDIKFLCHSRFCAPVSM
jgi:hypothetical protein